MQSQRFFIGNLPAGTSENEVKNAFKDFGDVTSVELKAKESLVDPGNVKLLAFITLNLYDGDVDFCIRKVNSKKINGENVRVSVAKESFLERLKREREENTKTKSKTTNNNFELKQPFAQSQNNSKKVFNIDDVAEADDTNDNPFDDGEPTLITKKRAANSMRNGKIVIESTNCSPITVIGKKKETKILSEKSFDSDKKRKESVNKKKNQYQLQKSLIQKSLASVDNSKNKQIFFDNDDEEKDEEKPSNGKKLFEDDSDQEDDSNANAFAVKPEYEGSRGAALMKLQSKMSLDPRFKIDSKFVDKIDDEDEPPVVNENSERDWQYGILEQVVGSKVSNTSQAKGHGKTKLNMLRYDPSKENQEHFLVQPKTAEPMDEDDENIIPQPEEKKVSKEVFYMVSDNLTNSLKTRGDGFSLLSMFGRGSDENELNEERSSKEKILISKTDKTGALNPFSYDSSSESENEQEGKTQHESEEGQKKKSKETKDDNKAKLYVESFFIPRNDVRLKEGKSFFRTNKQSEKIENYDEVKDKLKNIINRKITRSKKQLKGIGKQKSIRGR
ncbi:probable RNA-binding protein CG14230 [Episyrphus balteatus]|uniref:probable RNA-binding protein CG14230 n=1 Tax=Episyrphus balteatus TaxID=286459 RepID=UPI0024862FC7|nr:probable RNA-binding protein CG14230 [Episyrphus balteatus]